MRTNRYILILLAFLSLFRPHSTAQAASISVPCNVVGLIAAIESANASANDDTLILTSQCLYTLTVAQNNTSGSNGLPVIVDTLVGGKLVIQGNGAKIARGSIYTPEQIMHYLPLVISGGGLSPSAISDAPATLTAESVPEFRILQIASGADVTIIDLEMHNGSLPAGMGGGIFNEGLLTLNDSRILGNTALQGGGVFNTGTLTVDNSTFSGNNADGGGGAINSSGTMTVTDSSFANNTAPVGDGILVTAGTSTVTGSTFSGDTPYTCPASPHSIPAGDTAALINAIHCANGSAIDNVINLENSTYTLTVVDNDGAGFGDTGLPIIQNTGVAGKLTINGNGATISRGAAGTPNFRIFMLMYGGDLTLNTVTVQNGHLVDRNGSAIFSFYGNLTANHSTFNSNAGSFGGAIHNQDGALTLNDSTFTSNTSSGDGAAINSSGTLMVDNCVFSNNTATGLGGGIVFGGTTATVMDTTFASNTSFGNAGGSGVLIVRGNVTISSTTFANNYASGAGGGLFVSGDGVVLVTNSTFTQNDGYWGGAIWNGGILTVRHSTIYANSTHGSEGGGGIYNNIPTPVSLSNTIVAENSAGAGPDIAGTILSLGYNLIGNTSGTIISGSTTGNLIDAAAAPLNLGPLANNGGPTQTMALLPASVAINAGEPAFIGPPDYDQRGSGFPRVNGGRIDIGAFERNP